MADMMNICGLKVNASKRKKLADNGQGGGKMKGAQQNLSNEEEEA